MSYQVTIPPGCGPKSTGSWRDGSSEEEYQRLQAESCIDRRLI